MAVVVSRSFCRSLELTPRPNGDNSRLRAYRHKRRMENDSFPQLVDTFDK